MSEKKKSRTIALLSDVHGNLPALEAVLDEAAHRGADAWWYCGDFLGYAPFPNKVVQTLCAANAVSVIGNYDLKVLAFAQKEGRWKGKKTPEKYAAFQWNYEHLSPEGRAYLESLPQERRLEADGLAVLLVHGSPDSVEEHLGSQTPEQRFEELAEKAGVDLIACGHSHEAFVRRVRRTWIVNPGSVGRPEGGDWRASYAMLEFVGGDLKVEHRRVEYDIDRVVQAIHAAGLPDSFAEVFRQGRSLDQLQGGKRGHSTFSPAGSPTERTKKEKVECPLFRDEAGSVLAAVLALARSCNYEQEHTHQVTRLALEIFDGLQGLHGLGPQERLWLQYGALLHDIGWIEGQQEHHKTALRLILADTGLPLEHRERQIIGLIARYHRKAVPQPRHPYFRDLSSADQHRVCVLAGMLRVADGLDRSHANVIRSVRCKVSSREITIGCEADGPADGEIAAAEEKADLLESVLERRCVIKVPVQT
jgi:putative phosphoesterase